jgi:hypothetical protein
VLFAVLHCLLISAQDTVGKKEVVFKSVQEGLDNHLRRSEKIVRKCECDPSNNTDALKKAVLLDVPDTFVIFLKRFIHNGKYDDTVSHPRQCWCPQSTLLTSHMRTVLSLPRP